jgi:hypothetical protein
MCEQIASVSHRAGRLYRRVWLVLQQQKQQQLHWRVADMSLSEKGWRADWSQCEESVKQKKV